jgi:TetR/AcrR family tetracycline transcriptional repressor
VAAQGQRVAPARGALKARASKAAAPTARARWGTITRSQIIEAAMTVVRAGGYDQMTVRSLAADLGVAPMSLYRHVRDKDDLLDEVVDRLLAKAWRPRSGKDDWRAWVAEAADRLRRLLVSQPAALHVYLRHPVVSPAAIARMEAMMAVLRRSGADEQAARRAYAAVHTYTVGFAALEASRAGWSASGASSDSLASELASYTTPAQFAEGLRYLLEGIEYHSHLGTGAGGGAGPGGRPRPARPPEAAATLAAQDGAAGTTSEVPGRGPRP